MKLLKEIVYWLYIVFMCAPYSLWVFLVLLLDTAVFTLPVYFTLRSKNPKIKRLGRWIVNHVYMRILVYGSFLWPKIEGREHLDCENSQMFIPNHRDPWEFIVFQIMGPFTAFILKFNYAKNAITMPISWTWRLMDYPHIDRDKSEEAKKIIDEGVKCLKEQHVSIIMYPEGTRTDDNMIRPFKKGAFFNAIKHQIPILPMAHNFDYQDKRTYLIKPPFRRPHIIIGEPITTEGLTEKDVPELLVKTRNALIDLYVKVGGPGGDKSKPFAPKGNPKKQKLKERAMRKSRLD